MEGDTSQFHESSILWEIFEDIGTTSKWCFECGAGDPVNINTTHLFRQHGWTACLIEKDPSLAQLLRSQCLPPHIVIEAKAGIDRSLDDLLTDAKAPESIDFGVIDIDSFDYWMWHDLRRTPRVMCVEFWMSGEYMPRRDEDHQAGPAAILELAKSKGYREAARTSVNLIAIHESA